LNQDEIKALRLKLGLSREQFAVRIGCSYRTIYKWETGRAVPSPLANDRLKKVEAEANQG